VAHAGRPRSSRPRAVRGRPVIATLLLLLLLLSSSLLLLSLLLWSLLLSPLLLRSLLFLLRFRTTRSPRSPYDCAGPIWIERSGAAAALTWAPDRDRRPVCVLVCVPRRHQIRSAAGILLARPVA
jgi:hypothetical protein